ncbi:MAG: Nif3-like dinuclear metal center hexameric protein [Burkholderiaceae bacterium]|nr:Nif3-like dinuclear metal center hexameric protein [Burkholderiaceae bacterium]
MKSIATRALCAWLDTKLNAPSFSDYCPNGLQVEGTPSISHIVTGVTASQALIDVAIAQGADALLVHHGWFWKGEDSRITGIRKTRLASLMANNINLLAFHLPLDAHPELGNNAQLARVLKLTPSQETTGPGNLIWLGQMPGSTTLGEVAANVERALGRTPQIIGDPGMPAHRLAWCTGAAQSMMTHAIEAGAQVFITGEISEPTVHLAREAGVGFISAGHHATERYGVQALGNAIQKEFGIRVDFVDIDNPV